MSKGVASFSSLDYLHKGLQETAQRQVDEFENQIQHHFDWLSAFETSTKPESAVYVKANDPILSFIHFCRCLTDFLSQFAL